MKTWKHCAFVGVLAILVIFCGFGCSGNSLNGTWEVKDTGDTVVFSGNKMTLFENTFTYSISDGKIVLEGGMESSSFSRKGNTITMFGREFTRKSNQKTVSSSSGGSRSSLVGKWVPETGQNVPDDFIERRLELSSDGTGIGDGYSFTWKTERNRLTFNLNVGAGYAYDYRVSGSTLTLTNDDGKSVRYKKE